MFRRHSRCDQAAHRFRTLGLVALAGAVAACSSTPHGTGGLAPTRLRLASSLGTNDLLGCDETLQPDWPFPGAQRNIRLLRLQSRNVLVYDLVTRGSTKTIWQPLAPDYSFLGEGRTVGKTGRAQTLDFDLQEGGSGHIWTSYRYRYPSRSQLAAQVEWLPPDEPLTSAAPSPLNPTGAKKSRLATVAIPAQTTESVQNIWLMPNKSDRPWEADVITRVYRFSKKALTSDWQDSDAATLYYWYRIDGRAGTATLTGTYEDKDKLIESAQFLMLEQAPTPAAVTIERDAAAAGPAPHAVTRVKLRHLFADADRPTELFATSRSILSNLDAKSTTMGTRTKPPEAQDFLTVAWSLSSEENAGVRIQWIELPLQPPVSKGTSPDDKSSVGQQGAPRDRRQGFAVSSYPPVALHIRHLVRGTEAQENSTFLTWMTATSSETAFLALPIRDAATPLNLPQSDQVATERIAARAHVLQKEALIYAGTAFFPHDARAMLLFREPGNASAKEPGQTRVDAARLPVQICAVTLLKKGARADVQETSAGSANK